MIAVLPRWPSSTLPFLLFLTTIASAASTNRTIDDQLGDSVTGVLPSYSPAGSWQQGATCSGCFIHLDPSQTFQGTWHDSTHTPGDAEDRVITAQFTGTAVYVYNALANTVEFTTTFTNITFAIDGEQVGSFQHVPTESDAFQYNVPVFTKTGLANQAHTIVITAGGDTNSSLVLFDYIVYTFEDDPVTTQPTSITTRTVTASPTTSTSSSLSSSSSTSLTSSIASSVTGSTSPSAGTTTNGSATNGSPTGFVGTSTNSDTTLSSTSQTAGADGSSQTGSAANSVQGKSSFPVGAVAGGVAGGIVALLAAAAFLFFFCKRTRARSAPVDLLEEEKFGGFGGGTGGSGMQSDRFVGMGAQAGQHSGSLRDAVEVDSDVVSSSNPSSYAHTSSHHSPRPSTTDLASIAPYAVATTSSVAGTPPLVPLRRIPTNVPRSPESSFAGSPESPYPVRSSTDDYPPVTAIVPLVPHMHARAPSSVASSSTSGAGSGPIASPPPPRQAPSISPSRAPSLPPPVPAPAPIHPPSAWPNEKAIPIPPIPPDAPARARSPGAASTATGVSTLRNQVAMLQEEILRLREQQELQRLLDEAPPQYVEA